MTARTGGAAGVILTALLLSAACAGDPDGGMLLVTSGFTDQVFVVDAHSGSVLDSLELDRRPGERDEPHGVAVAPDGNHWYATLSHGEPTLWKYESADLRLVGRVTLPTTGASRVRLSPDGATAVVPDYWLAGSGAVSRIAVVKTHDLTVTATPEVCPAPHDAVFSPDGRRLAVTCALGDGVVILDAATLEVVGRQALADGPQGAAQAGEELPPGEGGVGAASPVRPMNAAWSPDGNTLWVSLMGRGTVVALSVATGARVRHPVGARPAQLEVSPDGSRVVVANRGDATVSVIDVRYGTARTVEMPGAHPHGVAFGTDPSVAFVTYEGDVETAGGVVALDLDAGALLWHTPVGIFTLGVAHLASGSHRAPR